MIQQEADQCIAKTQQKSSQETSTTKPPSGPPLLRSKRFLVVILMSLCFLNTAFIRLNISIAMVEMTSAKRIEIGNLTEIRPPEFDWDSKTIGLVLSLFYYGGLMSFLGGYMTTKLGGATSLVLSLMISGLTTILHPISLYCGFHVFLTTRFLTGIFENFVMISVSEVCSKWMPKKERGKLMSYVTTGIALGSAIVHTVCGYLAHFWGWPMIFYTTGAMSLVLSLLCFFLVKNRPSKDKRITEAELTYIEYQQENTAAKRTSNNPVAETYRNILLSAPIWALVVVKLIHTWVITITTTLLPLYVKDVTGDETNKVGVFSSIPGVASMLSMPLCGILLDYTRKINIPVTLTHKILISGSYVFGALLLTGVVMVPNFIASIIFFSFTMISISVVTLVTKIIVISIAPSSSGVIAGIDLFSSSISSIASRSAAGYMTTSRSREEWNNCFILASGFFTFGAVVFALYGSSDPQPWAVSSTSSDTHGNDLILDTYSKNKLNN